MFVEWVSGWLVKTLLRQIYICGGSIGLGSRAHVNDSDGDDQIFSRCSRSWVAEILECRFCFVYLCGARDGTLKSGHVRQVFYHWVTPPGQEYYVIKPLCLRQYWNENFLVGTSGGPHSPCCSLSLHSFGGLLHWSTVLFPAFSHQ